MPSENGNGEPKALVIIAIGVRNPGDPEEVLHACDLLVEAGYFCKPLSGAEVQALAWEAEEE